MSKVLVLGYGNTLRGDDGIGVRAAELLQNDRMPQVEVLALHQLAPELSEAISEASAVLFVDATRLGQPGDVACREVAAPVEASEFTHQFTPAALLALTEKLYGGSPRGFEISLCGENFDLADELSPRVATALPLLVGLVRRSATTLAAG